MYVIISSSILNSPYWLGNPFVDETTISEVVDVIPEDKIVLSTMTSGVRLLISIYCSKLSEISVGPPWYSCEI